jgi:hypothetical protein
MIWLDGGPPCHGWDISLVKVQIVYIGQIKENGGGVSGLFQSSHDDDDRYLSILF